MCSETFRLRRGNLKVELQGPHQRIQKKSNQAGAGVRNMLAFHFRPRRVEINIEIELHRISQDHILVRQPKLSWFSNKNACASMSIG
jgi:hypothetical protein